MWKKRVFDLMKDVLTKVNDPSIVLETMSQKSYLSLKSATKETTAKNTIKRL
ncbi:hypothetical protein CLU79DRAFT_694329 [Phycomyces nitens]|nr:hypothetical protein CLU79DRAFT_694329 [Phycomyces nitens]